MIRKVAKNSTNFEITCPCCSALLKIDVEDSRGDRPYGGREAAHVQRYGRRRPRHEGTGYAAANPSSGNRLKRKSMPPNFWKKNFRKL